jgi:predicted MFS family arabinose efflux permease
VLSFNVAAAAALVPSISRDFALSPIPAGRIVWFYMLAYGISALIYGPLVRIWDAKKVELWAMFLFAAANLLAALAPDINTLYLARVAMGIFGSSVIPLALILISRQVPSAKRGKFVGIFFSSTFAASLIGLFLSGFIPWRMIFLAPAITGFLLWLHMYWYLPSFKEECRPGKVNYIQIFKNGLTLKIFTYIFLVSLFYHGIQQWFGVYFSQRFAFSQVSISMLITLTSLSGIFGEVLGGQMADRWGRFKTINLGLILMIISAFAVLYKTPFFALALLMLVWGLGWTMNHAGVSTALTDLPTELIHESASLNSSVRFVSGGLGVYLGGVLMRQGLNYGFIVFGSLLLGLLLCSRPLLLKDREIRECK